MKTRDPIKNQLLIYAERGVEFVAIVLVLALVLWFASLWNVFQVRTFSGLWQATAEAWSGDNRAGWLLMRFAFLLSLSWATVFYLTLALWWRRAGEQHHRGAQLVGWE
jgi:hypothetical protein